MKGEVMKAAAIRARRFIATLWRQAEAAITANLKEFGYGG